MPKLIFMWAIFIASSLSLLASNREPDSPSGDYKFSLEDIQTTVRSGVIKADNQIQILQSKGLLDGIAHLYFQDYLLKIGSYNQREPLTVDLIESYKTDLVNAFVLLEFKERFPHLIYDRSKWMFNSVGGVYANMLMLYCSPDEYIVLWGTTIAADNKFSGYYSYMNEFDVMTRGVMHSHDLDAPGHASVIYQPIVQDGVWTNTVDTSNLRPGNVRSYNLGTHSYMVSYAQGNIIKAFFPGAIMPGIFVNQDWGGLALHFKEGFNAWRHSKKKYKEDLESTWLHNPNYRAIWIIDHFNPMEQK